MTYKIIKNITIDFEVNFVESSYYGPKLALGEKLSHYNRCGREGQTLQKFNLLVTLHLVWVSLNLDADTSTFNAL